jgi:hypothetical protein
MDYLFLTGLLGMGDPGFEFIFLGSQIFFEWDLNNRKMYLLSFENEGGCEVVTIGVKERDDAFDGSVGSGLGKSVTFRWG